jgi:cell division protein ZapA
MPDVSISIGGRKFDVACQNGEEPYLHAAAALLDREAQALAASGARLSQDRMLLMAGLMLADKSISADEGQRSLEEKLAAQAAMIDELQDSTAQNALGAAQDDDLRARFADLAGRAEALAEKAEGAA